MKRTDLYKLILASAVLFLIVSTAFRLKEKKICNIVFIGDSITESRMVENAGTFGPAAIATEYLKSSGKFQNVQFSNQGHSGYTTVDFLPETRKGFPGVIKAADLFADEKNSNLIFSIMLGTNDSAEKGPNGSPVAPERYFSNLKMIIDTLGKRYPKAKFVLNAPIYYSDSTQNRSVYLTNGRARLLQYFPQLKLLTKTYKNSFPDRVFMGDQKAFGYLKKHYLSDMNKEHGPAGTFYLHPNKNGAKVLGTFWGMALEKVID